MDLYFRHYFIIIYRVYKSFRQQVIFYTSGTSLRATNVRDIARPDIT